MAERVVIVDVRIPAGTREQLAAFGLTVVDAAELTGQLVSWEGWGNFNPQTTLVVLPGNGASIVAGYIPTLWLCHWRVARVHAKRYWVPGEDPVVIAHRIFSEEMKLGVKDVVVVDDVVSSGTTARLLHRVNEPWIPGARWHLAAWVGQRAYAARGFINVHAVAWFGTKESKVPINSLSTLMEFPEIAANYARRNLGERASEFLSVINQLK
jgi:hypoxanthine phosphoribosyltransferase